MAEHKGRGHPDTMCDEIVENISVAFSKFYLDKWGLIKHYNIDKALMVGGSAEPNFGGGKITKPITFTVAGRATDKVGKSNVPIEEIAVETARKWLRDNLRHLDVSRDIQIKCKIRSGSSELQELFQRPTNEVPLANDTSFGAGFYPLSPLEDMVLKIGNLLNHPDTLINYPFIGEDIKVMGVRIKKEQHFTVAIAMVDKHLVDLADYVFKIEKIKENITSKLELENLSINTADDLDKESIYLTVSGTSAEGGDDGQVGRGNRLNGLITPYRPMSLEATAGKNPFSHIGKIYNHFAQDLSKEIVQKTFAEKAQVLLVSQIGKPIDQPQAVHLRLHKRMTSEDKIEKLVEERLSSLRTYWKRILGGFAH